MDNIISSSELAPWRRSWRPLRQKYGNRLRIIVRDCIFAALPVE
jgi:hypothetical protein